MRNEERFLDMLQYTRPHKGKSEREYLERFIVPNTDWEDESGNLIKVIGADNPRILFSSHTDTVHKNDGTQQLFIDEEGSMLFSNSTCLGADDTVGNYLMLSMIEKKVPGMYIFHRGEEHGGIGSGWIAAETPGLLKDIEIAIALDRKGTDDVIQYQNFERCCSERFASDLANLMEITGGDEIGSFTDTANYTDLITECTNISVAYWNQHSKNETCNPCQIGIIEERLLKADWNSLKAYGYVDEDTRPSYTTYSYPSIPLPYTALDDPQRDFDMVPGDMDDYWELHDIVVQEPYVVSDYLWNNKITVNDLMQETTDASPRGNGNTRDFSEVGTLDWERTL